jgi:hypothetical protein
MGNGHRRDTSSSHLGVALPSSRATVHGERRSDTVERGDANRDPFPLSRQQDEFSGSRKLQTDKARRHVPRCLCSCFDAHAEVRVGSRASGGPCVHPKVSRHRPSRSRVDRPACFVFCPLPVSRFPRTPGRVETGPSTPLPTDTTATPALGDLPPAGRLPSSIPSNLHLLARPSPRPHPTPRLFFALDTDRRAARYSARFSTP